MPTYRFTCSKCGGDTEQWLSIHHEASERPTRCACAGVLKLAITGVRTYGVGPRGAETVRADVMDAKLDKERPAYRRMRDAGLQPPAVMGSSVLERHADDPMYVESGGVVAVPEGRRAEIREMMAEATHSDFDPVAQVHAEKGT